MRQTLQGIGYGSARLGIAYWRNLRVAPTIIDVPRLSSECKCFARCAERGHHGRLANHRAAIYDDQIYIGLAGRNQASIDITARRGIDDDQIRALTRFHRAHQRAPLDDRCRNTSPIAMRSWSVRPNPPTSLTTFATF